MKEKSILIRQFKRVGFAVSRYCLEYKSLPSCIFEIFKVVDTGFAPIKAKAREASDKDAIKVVSRVYTRP